MALSQLYARHAEVTNERGERFATATWSEIDTAQWMARQPRARAWFRVSEAALASACASAAWGRWSRPRRRPARRSEREAGDVTVETVAGVTTTLGGLAIDEHARAAPGVFACGADAGGIATGGYASGLAGGAGVRADRRARGARGGRP